MRGIDENRSDGKGAPIRRIGVQQAHALGELVESEGGHQQGVELAIPKQFEDFRRPTQRNLTKLRKSSDMFCIEPNR